MNTQTQTFSATPASAAAKTSWLHALQYKHATVVTAITFVIAGITGVMIFFHLGSGYVMSLHEWLGMAMVVAAALHLTRHFKALGKQLQKPRARIWLAAGALVTALFVGSAFMAPSGGSPMRAYIGHSLDAPVSAVGGVLNLSGAEVQSRLESAGLKGVSLDQSVKDLAATNHVGPEQILSAVMGAR